jgi:phosphoribosylamine--glycine ligase
VVSSGGRVLAVVGLGDDLGAARQAAYAGIEQIGLAGSFYRNDIAQQAAAGEIAISGVTR